MNPISDFLKLLYRYRELIYSLVTRELKLRYRGSILGFLWTFLNPLLLMLIYTLVFSIVMRIQMERYPAFLLSGLVPWIWFASSLNLGVNSIVGSAGLIKQAMFPPEILPTVTVISTMMNFIFTLPLLFVFLILFGVELGPSIIVLPLIVMIQFIFCLGVTLACSALNVYFRDLQPLIGNLIVLLFFLTPIVYPLRMAPPQYQTLLKINPLTIFIMQYKGVLFDGTFPGPWAILYLCAVSLLVLYLGIKVFDRYKDYFAEEV